MLYSCKDLGEGVIKYVQGRLGLVVDGKLGDMTYIKLREFGRERGLPSDWGVCRLLVSYIQMECKARGIEVGVIDGLWGVMTDYGYDRLRGLSIERVDVVRCGVSQVELFRYYGEVGKNQVLVDLPYEMKLAWDEGVRVRRISCHRRVSRSVVGALEGIRDYYGVSQLGELKLDLFGGCLNVRKKRGGSQWSEHAWGIAIDFAPQYNRLRWGRGRALFSRDMYEEFFDIWESVGFRSLGREFNYDWMHVGAVCV